MPPKKKDKEPERPPLMGRIGTSLKVGIVGFPNVGKTLFFNVLTKSQAAAENFPFGTIDPNDGKVPVPDERWEFLCDFFKPVSRIPAYLNVVDIAGLVKGSSEGQGLGNAFLSHVNACDAIFYMARAFESEDVAHVDGDVNPVRDLEVIFDELRLKDCQTMETVIEKAQKIAARGATKAQKDELEVYLKVQKLLTEEKKHVRFGDWSRTEIEVLNKVLLLTAKPIIYLVNISEKAYLNKKNKWLPKMKALIDQHDPGATLIPFSGDLEQKLANMPEDEAAAYLKANNATSMIDKIIKTGYKALQLESFFTTGEDEVKAWTIQKGTLAPRAAGRIHGDFEKGFIMAEVMKFEDFKAEGSEQAVKAAGKYKQQGKNYIVEDGDIILFKFNAGAGLTAGKGKKK